MRALAFTTLGRNRLISLIRPVNVPSQGVARKLGMTADRVVNFHGYRHLVFSVTRRAAPEPATG